MSIKKDNRGIAHPLFIVLAVVVIAAIGFAAWKVFADKKDTKTIVNSSGQTVTVDATAADKAAEKSCNNALHDKTLCKFAATFTMPSAYETTITSHDSSGTSSILMDVDGHNNTKMIVSKDSKETLATILLNGETYVKDEASGNWIKYPKSSDSSSSSSTTDASKGVAFDKTNWTESGTTSYKALGKEACGNLTCYKYQSTDTKTAGTTMYFWFDNKDYMMRRFSTTDSTGSMDMTLNYKSITITAPSPVVDYTQATNFDTSSLLNALGSITGTSQ
jgi:outer membrane lipoprotein-sorting protein